jgi:transcriptional regulator with XRE-family HTH domain
MQVKLLPEAAIENLPCAHLAPMEKRGDPIIGKRVKEARRRLRLSQQQLADGIRVGRSTITGIETAHRPIGRETLMDLAEFCHVPVDYFTHRNDLMASAMWVLGRLPEDELRAWVQLMMARATRDSLPPRD